MSYSQRPVNATLLDGFHGKKNMSGNGWEIFLL
jgi:hypothetical protein